MDAIKEAMIREEDTGEINPALDPYRERPTIPGTFAFLPKLDTQPRSRRQHMVDIRKECFGHKLKHLADDCVQARDMVRDLIKSGEDVSQEIAKLTSSAKALTLMVKLLEREI